MTELLGTSWAFFRRDAQLAASYPIALLLSLSGTVLRVVMLWLPAQLLAESSAFARHGGFIPFAVVGTAMMGFFMASYGGFAGAVRSEQAMGTLESVLMTPARVAAVVIGSSSWAMTRSVLDATITLLAAALFFDLQLRGSPISVLLVLILTNLTFAGVGMFSAAFTVVFKRGDPFRVLIAGASFLLGGVVYPIEVLPGWIRTLSQLLPVTHGARALRGLLLEGRALSSLHTEILALAAFAGVTVPLGLVAFRWAVGRAKRDGSLLQY